MILKNPTDTFESIYERKLLNFAMFRFGECFTPHHKGKNTIFHRNTVENNYTMFFNNSALELSDQLMFCGGMMTTQNKINHSATVTERGHPY